MLVHSASTMTHNFFDFYDDGRLKATYRDAGAERVTYSYNSTGEVTATDATSRQVIMDFGIGFPTSHSGLVR